MVSFLINVKKNLILAQNLNRSIMKRLLISILILTGISAGLLAQEVVLLNYNTLERKYEKSLEKTQDEKHSVKSKTWLKHGELLQDIYKIDLEFLSEGVSEAELKLYYKEPASVTTETEGSVNRKILKYERMDYIFENGGLSRWVRKKSVVEKPLDLAWEAYRKALDQEDAGKVEAEIKENLTALKGQYMQDGINSYYKEQMGDALHSFEMVMNINELDLFEGVVDTVMVQYSGIIARELGQYEKAAKYYLQLAELNFGGPSIYLNVKNDFLEIEDSVKAIEVMEKAFEVYPDTLNVVANLIDLYIRTNKIEQGIAKVEQAIEGNPQKGEFYYWKGRLLLNSTDEDRIEKAVETYEKAIELNPNLYYVYYDIGFIYFLQGQDIFSQAGLEKDVERRKQINEIATEKYEEALPMLQKAYELNDANADIKCETLDVLKRIYYKLKMDDDYNRIIQELNNNGC